MSAQATASAPSKEGPVFVWPKPTRVSYKLEGNYRGPIYGQATVERETRLWTSVATLEPTPNRPSSDAESDSIELSRSPMSQV